MEDRIVHEVLVEEKPESFFAFVLEMFKMFVLALVIVYPIKVFLLQPFIVRGISMEPNFSESQYLVTNEIGYKYTKFSLFGKTLFDVNPSREFSRQNVVVLRSPVSKDEFYIKRVIGLPGETIEIKDGIVKIYNEENKEGFIVDEKDYLPEGRVTAGEVNVQLKDDEYYVLGDNRSHSSDSRSFGPLKKEQMIGKVILRAWPVKKMGVF